MSPERSGSPQDEAATPPTPKMSVPASPVAGTPPPHREAQSPISLLLAVAQSQNHLLLHPHRNGDDDLTSLTWLHDRDLLKGMNINPSPSNSTVSTPVKYGPVSNQQSLTPDQFSTSDYVDDSSISSSIAGQDNSSSPLNSPASPYHQNSANSSQQRTAASHSNGPSSNNNNNNKHPHNIPYDPLKHTTAKPPYSFSCLIFMAIEDSRAKALPVKEIYAWITDHFPFYKTAPTGWKNSVRHNLSLNKCFQKVEKAPNLGKGSLWTVDEQYRPNLLQALSRTHFHPCSTIDPSNFFNNNKNNNSNNNNNSGTKSRNSFSSHQSTPGQSPPGNNRTTNLSNNNNNNVLSRLPNPELYPYLSRKLALTAELNGLSHHHSNNNNNNIKNEISHVMIKHEVHSDESSLDAVDAATVMLSLKNGPRYRQTSMNSKRDLGKLVSSIQQQQQQVITSSPSEDHTYSAAADESDEERTPKSAICRKLDFEDEEERKIKEGAETLLNLAGVTAAASTTMIPARNKRRSSSHSNGCYAATENNNNNGGCHDDTSNNNNKRLKSSPMMVHQFDVNENDLLQTIKQRQQQILLEKDEDGRKTVPFKPRLLIRAKKKDLRHGSSNNSKTKSVSLSRNNLNNNNNSSTDEWMKHRRELDIIDQQHR